MNPSEFYYVQLVTQHAKMLANLRVLLLKGAAFAQAKKFDVQALLADRLAPDMHPLVQQVRIACDTARLAAARIAGRTAPAVAEPEASIDGLVRYCDDAIAYLGSFGPGDFAAGDEQVIVFPWNPGKGLTGRDYFLQFAVPNVYFHVAATYMLLRTNGVEIGKADFLGALPFAPA